MNGLEQYLWPYIITQVAGILFLVAAWKNTRLARVLLSLLFLWAAGTNMYLGLTKPVIYQDYATTALPFYRNFINGWFSHYTHIIVPFIAAGQLLIGIGMLLKNKWVKWACIGVIIFLLSIAPLMVGAGFPFSITVSIAAFLILRKDDRRAIFSFSGYKFTRN